MKIFLDFLKFCYIIYFSRTGKLKMSFRFYLEQQNLYQNLQPRPKAKNREIPTFFKLLNEGKVNLTGYSKLPECKTKFKEVVLNSEENKQIKNVWDLFAKETPRQPKAPKQSKYQKKFKNVKPIQKKEEIKCSQNINDFFNDFLAGKYKNS